jgi:mono/diheme cytochrome c family protein
MVWKLPVERVALKPGNGQAAITGQCAVCHSLDYLTTQPRLTRTAWQATVDKMRSRYQAQLNTNLVPVVVNYLVENYGRENPVPAAK